MQPEFPKRRSQETINRILDAAVRHFAQMGFNGARVDEIAAQARVNKAALYYHIGDKAALYEMVIERVLGHVADHVAENIRQTGTSEEALRTFITTVARNISGNQHFAPMMMREIASGGANLPESVLKRMQSVFLALLGILEEAMRMGRFRPMNPVMVHLTIIGGWMLYVGTIPIREKIASAGHPGLPGEIVLPIEKAEEQFADLVVAALKG
jgi:AcrR family transcriptional regulator